MSTLDAMRHLFDFALQCAGVWFIGGWISKIEPMGVCLLASAMFFVALLVL